ncbi:extracellular solute-binding protein [Streptomyces sp. NPDC048845]|uniref:extracellular solute-binding protein n=1 Tax=Streptomyces sp. NPDC048845 TaxID=3155390 RepID=UPI0034412743
MPRNSRPRPVVHALAGLLVAASVFGCGAPDDNAPADDDSPAAIPDKPSKPVALEILDVAGNLQLTQPMIDDFVEQNPDIVSKVSYDKAPAPDLAGKIKAQQQADRVQIDLVLTGTDGLAAGISQNLWTDMSAHEKAIGGAPDYLEPAADMQELAQGKGTVLVYYPSGPLIQYSPGKVTDPPGSPQELLAWAKENPKKFQYADPANSGPGRTFLMGLPHLLGDKDPKDPKSWDKTWKYLKELDKYIDNYASGTTETMQNLADGQVDMVATTTGWYINQYAATARPYSRTSGDPGAGPAAAAAERAGGRGRGSLVGGPGFAARQRRPRGVARRGRTGERGAPGSPAARRWRHRRRARRQPRQQRSQRRQQQPRQQRSRRWQQQPQRWQRQPQQQQPQRWHQHQQQQ